MEDSPQLAAGFFNLLVICLFILESLRKPQEPLVIGCYKGAPSKRFGLEPEGTRLHPLSDPF
jgi:hypothetical protein